MNHGERNESADGVSGGGRSPTILFVAQRYEHGKKEWGDSFEYWNFAKALSGAGIDLAYFDFGQLGETMGKAAMNRRLEEVVRAEKPDVMFTVLFGDELDKAVVRRLSEETETRTYNWFCDDHWRFEHFTRRWASCFNLVSTTSHSAVPKYNAEGIGNFVMTQWAVNPFVYRRVHGEMEHGVSFVGQPHGTRRAVIQKVRDAGIEVDTFGSGWDGGGRISQEAMIRVFGLSKINLNLSASSVESMTDAKHAKVQFARKLKKLGVLGPLMAVKNALTGKNRKKGDDVGGESLENAVNLSDQIKGRNFEAPGSGGFLLTAACEGLDEYYEFDGPGGRRDDGVQGEVAVYRDLDEMVEKARYYLEHEDERAAIQEAGYRRTIHEHTYLHRFAHIFDRLGHPLGDPASMLSRQGAEGVITEISAG